MNLSPDCLPRAAFRPWALSCLFAVGALTSVAQTVEPATPAENKSDEVIELSPFVVSADSNIGYVATSSLGGGRLKTDYRDIASQVSVMTPEFLSDINAFDLDEAYKYSTNIESGAEVAGSTSNFFGGSGLGVNANNRSRGLGPSTTTRNFFATAVPTSFYNTFDGGVTMASGPNAILFGLGTAGGITDSRLNSASLTQQKGQLKINADSFGTLRGSLDYNLPLIPKKLALRVDLLNSAKKFYSKPNYENDKRAYAALKFEPIKRVTMELFTETMDRRANRPVYVLPKDQVSAWLNPGIGNSTPFNTPNTTPSTLGSLATTPGSNGYLSAWGTGDAARAPSYTFGSGVTTPGVYFYRYVGDVTQLGEVLRSGYGAGNFPNDMTLQGEEYYPFKKYSPYGTTHPSEANSKSLMSVNTVRLAEGLFLELAGNWEKYKQRDANLFFNTAATIHIDPNAFRYNPGYIPLDPAAAGATGTANQAANAANRATTNSTLGKLYLEGQQQANFTERSLQEFRASLAYELNPEKHFGSGFARFVNRQRLFGNISVNETSRLTQEQRRYILDKGVDPVTGLNLAPAVITSAGAKDIAAQNNAYFTNANASNRNFTLRQYIDPNDPANRYGSFNGLDPWSNWSFSDNNGSDFQAGLLPAFAASGNRTKDFSTAFSWQGYFLKDRLILTYGKRWDRVDTKDIVTQTASARTGLFTPYEQVAWVPYSRLPTFINDTKSVVLHPLRWLSFHYNESTNNEASAPTNHDINGQLYSVPTGNGKDYGISVEYKGLTLRVNKFKTASTSVDAGNQFGNNGLRASVQNLELRYIQLMRNRAQALGLPAFDDYYLKDAVNPGFNPLDNTRTYYRIFSDAVAKGTEFELMGKVGKFDLRVVVGKQTATKSNVGPLWLNYGLDPVILQRMANVEYWIPDSSGVIRPVSGFTLNAQGNPTNTPIFTTPGASDILKGWQNIRRVDNNTQSMLSYWGGNVLRDTLTSRAFDGVSNPRVRGLRASATVGYRFNKGWRAGTTVSYREKAIISYYDKLVPVFDNNNNPVLTATGAQLQAPASDLDRPVYNSDEFYFDPFISYTRKLKNGTKMMIQLNITNILNTNGIYKIDATASDTNAVDLSNARYSYYGWTDATNVPVAYTAQDPRSFSLTVTFDF